MNDRWLTSGGQNASRANSYLAQFKRSGRIPAVVDFVASGSRFKIWLPKQGVKLTLVLSGIRCPRTARNPGEKAEPYGQEAFELVNARAMQRDAEIEVDTTDKSGGKSFHLRRRCDELIARQASSAPYTSIRRTMSP